MRKVIFIRNANSAHNFNIFGALPGCSLIGAPCPFPVSKAYPNF